MTQGADTSQGSLLGGRVAYRQLRTGHRSGIEPVLLAATIPAAAGAHVLEGGTGAGAGLLCLAARCPGVTGLGVERDGGLAGLARENVQGNGLAGLHILEADLLALPAFPQPFDHAFANPPWHDAAATASPDPLRDAAKRASPGLLARWAAALAAPLRHGGSLSLIVPAAAAADALAALAQAGCGSPALLPLWPHAGEAARIVVVRGVKGGRGGCRVLPGLVLHDGPAFTAEARAVLWDGAALPI